MIDSLPFDVLVRSGEMNNIRASNLQNPTAKHFKEANRSVETSLKVKGIELIPNSIGVGGSNLAHQRD